MIRRRRRTAVAAGLAVVLGLGGMLLTAPRDRVPRDGPLPDPNGRRTFASDDPVTRACALEERYLVRLWRGLVPGRSEDVIIVPHEPNYWGSFDQPSHTGPWDYLQEIPLVLYGPGFVPPTGRLKDPVTLAEVYATLGELLDVDLPRRTGGILDGALSPGRGGVPDLVLFVMWDGVGRNVLTRWPNRWPHLRRLEEEGVSFARATVGSSPSVTPATHATLSTGSFPRRHGVTGVHYRTEEGAIRRIFEGGDPAGFETSTFADEIDIALGNEPEVGLLAWQIARPNNSGPLAWESNHLTMLGHGSSWPGGDADEMALIGHEGTIAANPRFFSLPPYLDDFPGFEEHSIQLDRDDGKADGKWMGHDISASHDNPAWVDYQTDVLTAMLDESNYGADDVPDLFFTTYKATDLAGHHYFLDSPEMAAVLKAQDDALGEIIDYLDANVDEYVVIVGADHGHTPSVEQTRAWPISPTELQADVDARFRAPAGASLIAGGSAGGLLLDRRAIDEARVTAEDVAQFLNGYTIRDNWPPGDLPAGYEDRSEEPVLAAAFSSGQIDEIMSCAFGSDRPSSTGSYPELAGAPPSG